MRDERRALIFIPVVIGIAVALYGLMIVIAWPLHIIPLIQFQPEQAPMQFNTALGLCILGVGLIAAMFNWRVIRLACGFFGLALGTLTLAQYIFNSSLGIDELATTAYLNVATSTPGRMAPNTALCFILTGLALVCVEKSSNSIVRIFLSGLSITVTTAVALLALSGYFGNVISAYGWMDSTQMALPTAVVFAVLSFGLAMCGWMHFKSNRLFLRIWLPLVIAISTITIASGLWLALLAAQSDHFLLLGKKQMAEFVTSVALPIESRIHALGWMKNRWEFRGAIPQVEWESDAIAYQQEKDSYFRAIERADRDGTVRWAVPLKGNEIVKDFDLSLELNRLAAMETARVTRTVQVTHIIELAQGDDGFLAIYPLFHDDHLNGFIVGVFNARTIFDHAIRQSDPLDNYAFQVFDGERKIFGRSDYKVAEPHMAQENLLNIHGITWRVRIWPKQAFLTRQGSSLPGAVLAAGIFVTVLLTLIALLMQLARERGGKLREEISERRKVEEQNALLTSELQVVFENSIVGIAFIKDHRIVRCNRQFAEILGYCVNDIVGQTVEAAHSSEAAYKETARAVYDVLDRGDSFNSDLELIRRDGTVFWAACLATAVESRDISKGAVWVLEDISARKAAENRFAYQALHDSLTGLPNRVKFADHLNLAINFAARHGQHVAVCYLDLDRFKFVNDTYGHQAGDRLLIAVSQRLLSSVRDTDTVCRLGGDEFAIVLFDQIDEAIITTVAKRILKSIGQPIDLGNQEFSTSGSMGIAIYPQDGLDLDTLLKNADKAMYHAKQLGRNNFQICNHEERIAGSREEGRSGR